MNIGDVCYLPIDMMSLPSVVVNIVDAIIAVQDIVAHFRCVLVTASWVTLGFCCCFHAGAGTPVHCPQ